MTPTRTKPKPNTTAENAKENKGISELEMLADIADNPLYYQLYAGNFKKPEREKRKNGIDQIMFDADIYKQKYTNAFAIIGGIFFECLPKLIQYAGAGVAILSGMQGEYEPTKGALYILLGGIAWEGWRTYWRYKRQERAEIENKALKLIIKDLLEDLSDRYKKTPVN